MIYVALSAFGGGILTALLGWLDSQEPFNARKFGRSMVAAILSGIGYALAYSAVDVVGMRDILTAILGGAGVDVISNRVLGTVRR